MLTPPSHCQCIYQNTCFDTSDVHYPDYVASVIFFPYVDIIIIEKMSQNGEDDNEQMAKIAADKANLTKTLVC